MAVISRRHFQMYFLEWKCINFYYDFTKVCSQGSNWQYSSIGSDNGAGQETSHYLNQWWLVYWRIYICVTRPQWVNSSSPNAAYMRQWIGSSLVQVMACHLFGAKLLREPVLAYWQLHSWRQISVKFESEFYHFHSRKCIWNCRLPKWRSCCPRGDEVWLILFAVYMSGLVDKQSGSQRERRVPWQVRPILPTEHMT